MSMHIIQVKHARFLLYYIQIIKPISTRDFYQTLTTGMFNNSRIGQETSALRNYSF